MSVECQIIWVRLLASVYKAKLKAKHIWMLVHREEREVQQTETPLFPATIEKPITNRWEEALAAYRYRHGRASVPKQARIALLHRNPQLRQFVDNRTVISIQQLPARYKYALPRVRSDTRILNPAASKAV